MHASTPAAGRQFCRQRAEPPVPDVARGPSLDVQALEAAAALRDGPDAVVRALPVRTTTSASSFGQHATARRPRSVMCSFSRYSWQGTTSETTKQQNRAGRLSTDRKH